MPIRRVMIVLQSTAVGGMETHCRYHAAELVRRGVRVTVVIPTGPAFDELAAAVAGEGSVVVRLDTDARSGRPRQLAASLRLLFGMRRADVEVVHLHTGGATGGLFVVAAARLGSRATVVVTEHDVPAEAPAGRDRWARRAMDRLAHCLVAVSRRNASLRVERLGPPPVPIACVLNGVPIPTLTECDVAAHRAEVRRRLDVPDGAAVIGSLVRLAEGKGLRDLLRAFAGLRSAVPAILMLVGDGPLRDELAALAAELGVADRVRFAGHQRQPAAFQDAMDVFVLAVPAGSMSIALLETMARGVAPVITFCGPEEAVVDGRTGRCAPPGDPAGLARVLDQVLDDPDLRRRLGGAARRCVAGRFSAARVADDLLAVYSSRSAGVPERLRLAEPRRIEPAFPPGSPGN